MPRLSTCGLACRDDMHALDTRDTSPALSPRASLRPHRCSRHLMSKSQNRFQTHYAPFSLPQRAQPHHAPSHRSCPALQPALRSAPTSADLGIQPLAGHAMGQAH